VKVDNGDTFVEKMWMNTMKVNVIIPHELSLIALHKTNKNSKIVFMTSGLAKDFERDYHLNYAAYAGSKASLSHLMLSLSYYNEAIVCALSPHFPDEEDLKIKKYQETFDRMMSLTNEDKGKIIRLY
jgi:NAD(P)-dependent dehydrogenase (short-subunit alcohol dehydrogenase family)